jgi:hypothetical protein
MELTMTNTAQRNRQLPLLQQIQMRASALPEVNAAATAWMPILSGTRRADVASLLRDTCHVNSRARLDWIHRSFFGCESRRTHYRHQGWPH